MPWDPAMFVVTLTYTGPTDQIDARRPEHRAWLDPHVAAGLMLVTGPLVSRTGGVLIVSGKIGRAELEDLLKQDPFSVHGLADYALIEFEANKVNPALAGLV